MKSYLLFAIFSCFFIDVHAIIKKSKISHVKEESLNGKVLWVKTEGKLTFYDSDGYLIYSRVAYRFGENDSVLLEEDFYRRNAKGDLVEQSGYSIANRRRILDYVGDTLVEEKYYDFKDSVLLDIVYSYDVNTVIAFVIADGKKKMTEKNIYDVRGNLIEKTGYSGEGRISLTLRNRYDDTGNLIESEKTYTNFKYNKIKYKYNDSGWKSAELHYRLNDTLENKTTYNYGADGKLEKEIIYEYVLGNTLKSTTTRKFRYNEKRALIEVIEQYSSGQNSSLLIERFSDFDSMGNYLVKSTTIENRVNGQLLNKQTTTAKRKIGYYK